MGIRKRSGRWPRGLSINLVDGLVESGVVDGLVNLVDGKSGRWPRGLSINLGPFVSASLIFKRAALDGGYLIEDAI